MSLTVRQGSEEQTLSEQTVQAQQLHQLGQLHQIYDRVENSFDLDQFSQSIVEAVKDVLGYSRVSIHLLENHRLKEHRLEGDEEDVLVSTHHVGFLSSILRVPLSKGVVGRVARSGQPCLVRDVRQDADFISQRADVNTDINSEVAVPLFEQKRVAGVLNVESCGEQWLSEEDLKLMIVLGRYISVRLEQIQLFNSLKESEMRYRNLIDNLPGIVYRCANDAKWTEELINHNTKKITGYPGEDFYHNTKRTFEEIIHPDDRAMVRRVIEEALAKRMPYDLEYRFIHADGTVRWVFDRGQAILDEQGNPKHLEGVILDITERKQAAEALRAAQERNQALLQAIPDLMFMKSKDGVYLDYHASRREDLLFPPEFFIGKHSSEVMPPELVQLFLPLYTLAIETGQLQVTEYPMPIGDEQRFFEARIVPCGEDKVLTIIREITERKLAELMLIKRTAEVEAINRMKDEFLASMSHELRTPLSTILTYGESLQEGIYGDVSDQQKNILVTMDKSGRHLLSLINDVLDVAKIESGKFSLDLATVSVQEICESSVQLIKEEVRKKRIKFSQVFDHDVQTLHADGRRLMQILVNLLTNAVKFTPEGGRIGLEVTGDAEQKAVQFTVWDTGIAAEDQERVFQPFIQIDSSLARHYEGTGLGLTLVQRLVQMHSGNVTLESEPGRGTRFVITLPWDQNEDAPVTKLSPTLTTPITSSQRGSSPIEKRNTASLPPSLQNNLQNHSQTKMSAQPQLPLILLAEDNVHNATALEDFLTNQHYRVVLAQNGLQAIEQANKHHPDLILMDVQMPEMDGLAATRRIRAQSDLSNIPIIALTAFAMPGDRERCREAGVTEYVSKPVSLRQLAQVIEGQLRH